jgi:undecaprenyl-diphosphatase
MSHMTYLEASVVGLIQGVTELFPVSSLGHNVLIPALIGGSWAADLNVSKPESPYLAYIVGLHVATAIGMLIYFWRDWVRIIGGFFSSIRDREVRTVDQKMAWMIIFATIPVGVVGLKFEHTFRVIFGEPIRAAIFLMVNGVILFAGERFRTKKSLAADAALEAEAAAGGGRAEVAAGAAAAGGAGPGGAASGGAASGAGVPGVAVSGTAGVPAVAGGHGAPMHASGQRAARQVELARSAEADARLSKIGYWQALLIGSAQILALFAGISRDGVVMVTGMFRGLSRQDAARFSFLLSTPVILAAGVLKVPDLTGSLGNGIRGQILVGSVLSGVGAYLSVRFLMKYFQTKTLTPFAIYCLAFGLFATIYLSVR